MICISSPAGVRMAKAGKAFQKAWCDYLDAGLVDPKDRFKQWTDGIEALNAAEKEWQESVLAVADELYDQNLHEMTGP